MNNKELLLYVTNPKDWEEVCEYYRYYYSKNKFQSVYCSASAKYHSLFNATNLEGIEILSKDHE